MLEEMSDSRQQFRQIVHIFNDRTLLPQFARYGNQVSHLHRIRGHFQYANRTATDDGAPAAGTASGPERSLPGRRPETGYG